MNDKGVIAPCLPSSLVNLFKLENKGQLNLLKDPISTRMKGFLINTTIPVTLYGNLLVFRDSNKFFNSDGELLKTMTNYDSNVSHSNPQDQKLIYELGIKRILLLRGQDRKVTERDLLLNYFNH